VAKNQLSSLSTCLLWLFHFLFFSQNVLLYKLFVLGVVLASIGAFFAFFRKLTGSSLIPAIAVMLLPVTLQFRGLWDPVLAFSALYPLIYLILDVQVF